MRLSITTIPREKIYLVNNDLLLNCLRVLRQNWQLLFILLVCVGWGTLLIFAFLKKITGDNFTDPELVALALSGWPLPALCVSLLLLLLRAFLPVNFIFMIALALIIVSAGFALRAVCARRFAAMPW